jgi:hypothetical protein
MPSHCLTDDSSKSYEQDGATRRETAASVGNTLIRHGQYLNKPDMGSKTSQIGPRKKRPQVGEGADACRDLAPDKALAPGNLFTYFLLTVEAASGI